MSPGFTPLVAQGCADAGLPLLPGVATASEVMMAREAGFEHMKFFPALQAGGIQMLKAWQGPFFDVKFCPTGGISPSNAADFLALSNVVCVGGSWLVPADVVAQKDWNNITRLAWDTNSLKAVHA
ncbi:KHG/KDPG aldolase [bioreactor metagenome]|uniref:KHG/KDPG aldolase n=1 Tax=bioreactor metagenome TaxID=1076179 RepID=A0A645CUF4_9ZZZZ